MSRASVELAKLEQPAPVKKTNEIADIYKTSTLLLNVSIFTSYSPFNRIDIIKFFLGSLFFNR